MQKACFEHSQLGNLLGKKLKVSGDGDDNKKDDKKSIAKNVIDATTQPDDQMDDEMDDEFYSAKQILSPIPPTLSHTPVNIKSFSPIPVNMVDKEVDNVPNMVDKKVDNVPNMVDKKVDNAFMVEQASREKQEAIEKAIEKAINEADKKFKQEKEKIFENFNKDKKEIEQYKQETIKKN